MYYVELIGFMIGSYLLGNISPSILISRYIYGFDIRTKGSGNAGTTNVLRVLGWKAAAGTLAVDVLKGFLAVYITVNYCGDFGGMLAFVAVCLGHIYPVFFHFKGGKGVATALGAIWALNWPSAFACMLIAFLILAISHKMSMASLSAAICYPLLTLFYYPNVFPSAVLVAIVIIYTHRSNIKLLLKGEEKSLSVGSSKAIGKFAKNAATPEPLLVAGENRSVYFPAVLEADAPKDYFENEKEPKLGEKKRKVAVLGSGTLAYALGDLLSHHGHQVMLYAEKEEANRLKEERTTSMLPGILLSKKMKYTSNVRTLVNKRDFVLLAMTMQEAEEELPKIKKHLSKDTILINAVAGLTEDGKTSDKWLASSVENPVVSLATPINAFSLVQNEPVTFSIYGSKKACRKKVSELFTGLHTRVLEQKDAKGIAYLSAVFEAYSAAAILRGDSPEDSFYAIAKQEVLPLTKALGLKEETVNGPFGLGALFFLREEAPYAAWMKLPASAEAIAASVLSLAKEKKIELPLLEAVLEELTREDALEEAAEELSEEAEELSAEIEEATKEAEEELREEVSVQVKSPKSDDDTSKSTAQRNRNRAALRKIRYRERRSKKRMNSRRRNG